MYNGIAEWERAKTTRRYIHPPRAERIITMWADGKVMLGEVEVNPGPKEKPYEELICHGIWFTYGNEEIANFKTVKNIITEDGIPFHAIENDFGKLRVNIEAVSNIERKTTGFIKVTLKNTSKEAFQETFGFLLRTGQEKKLIFGSPDVYYPYESNLPTWKETKSTWKKVSENLFADGDRFVGVNGISLHWNDQRGVASFVVNLQPSEECVFYLSLGKGESFRFNYEEEKRKSEKWWTDELNKINQLPSHVRNNPGKVKMIRHLAAQILQCLCYPLGEDFLLCRQGGLQRLIWPFEALFALEAIGRIGDYGDYIHEVIACYFDVLQTEEGEIAPLGNYWAMQTGNVLYSFAAYCEKDKVFYAKYRDKAMAAFEWIRNTRASSAKIEGCFPGLFPPLRSCDCVYVFQALFTTDVRIVFDLKRFLDTVETFNDPRADEVRAEYEDYIRVIASHFAYLLKEAEGKDEIRHTVFAPELQEDENNFSFQPSMWYIPRILHIENKDVERIINYGKKRGYMAERGLYFKMKDNRPRSEYNLVDEDGVTRVWYSSQAEFEWFYIFMGMGDTVRAKETLNAMIQYAMTDELYMIERYHPRNPYFGPWSPNASGNGRVIQMLIDFDEST